MALTKTTKQKKIKVAHTWLPELIPVLGSQPAGDVSHKPGGRVPLLSARPAVTLATLKRAGTNFAAWWTEARWVWWVCPRLLPTASRLRFEPRPYCAWVQHANHSATEQPKIWLLNVGWHYFSFQRPDASKCAMTLTANKVIRTVMLLMHISTPARAYGGENSRPKLGCWQINV